MLDTTLTPSVKTKTGDVTDKNNYRPIAVATSMSKVMELLILSKTECFLNTSDNQFGFKKKHGTDMCIHAFRQIIEYYKQNASPVVICYLHATKAFDRVNHWLLLTKTLGPSHAATYCQALSLLVQNPALQCAMGWLFV